MAEDRNKENCEILFEYLRSILYDEKAQHPDFEEMDAPFRKLAAGLEFLQRNIEEMKKYSEALSVGNLSEDYPPKENFLCANLKNLHANLNHLTWQAKQVASGDYSQHVSYLGDFSDSFNQMIAQLKEREELLKKETENAKNRIRVIEEYNKLFMEVVKWKNEWVLVVDADDKNILYCNQEDVETLGEEAVCKQCEYRKGFLQDIKDWDTDIHSKVWERGDKNEGFYRITTFHIDWRGHNAYAHVVENITEDKQVEKKLFSRAYYDAGTGIYNRFFFEEYMTKQLRSSTPMILCYMDLDGLKYVNDKFGHREGDEYIRDFVSLISESFRNTDAFARIGGDEFCLVILRADASNIEEKMEGVRKKFIEENKKPYPVSFSYGVVEVNKNEDSLWLDQIIDEADKKMYAYKNLYKIDRGE